MDQSSSIMSLMGSALLIDFYPELDAQVVGLPDFKDFGQKPVFVIANTMVTSNKHVTAPRNYNLRVVETRLAAAILVKHLKLDLKGIVTLKQVHEAQFGLEGDAVVALEKMVDICKVFKNEPYSMREICKELELSEQELRDTFIKGMVIEATEYKLKNRAIHVFSEAKRVYDFKQICSQTSASISQLEQLGALMNASHSSCRDLFECSCTELDQLTAIATKNGAFGSRLTGAGWGNIS